MTRKELLAYTNLLEAQRSDLVKIAEVLELTGNLKQSILILEAANSVANLTLEILEG